MKATICNFCKCTIDIDKGYYHIPSIVHVDPIRVTQLHEISCSKSTVFLETESIDVCPECWEKFKAAIAPLVKDENYVRMLIVETFGGGDGTDKPS